MHLSERASLDLSQIPHRAAHRAPRAHASRLAQPLNAFGQDSQSDAGSRLIIPGQERSGPSTGRLVLPGSRGGSSAAPDRRNFRPPPGFMDSASSKEKAEKSKLSTEEMLSRLRSGHGHWYDLAQYVPLLAEAGYDAATLENETGLERPRQNVWVVAAQVHASLRKAGMDKQTLRYFDLEDADMLLYELRFLDLSARPAAAAYIAEKEFNTPESVILSRAIREHARRQGQEEGFSSSPGDCMAYKYYRDSIETKKETDRQACIAKALAAAETESATQAIKALGEEKLAELTSAAPWKPALQIVRMTGEEMSFRPVALAGPLNQVTPAALAAAPQTRQTGAFHAFEAAGEPGQKWVVMPAWHALMVSRRPVCLYISNCQDVPAIVAASAPRNEEERKRLAGPAMLLTDTDNIDVDVEPDQSYLVAITGSNLAIVAGRDISPDTQICARILLCCRPATISKMPLGADDSAMVQV